MAFNKLQYCRSSRICLDCNDYKYAGEKFVRCDFASNAVK